MGKKRKTPAGSGAPEKRNGFDSKSKMRAYTSYEDLADSEDEFHINRDKVMLEDGPDVKRRKKWQEEDAELEPSDEEVLAYSESDEDDEAPAQADEESDNEKVEEEDEDAEGWGSSRKDYYNNDEIQTEADALEEEAEARRLQKKKLAKMTDADFGLDDLTGWGDSGTAAEEGGSGEKGDVVTEVLERARITPGMSGVEIRQIMQPLYPEYDFIADELLASLPALEDLREQLKVEEATGQKLTSKTSATLLKVRALTAYVSTMSMYFALLSSPEDGPLGPDELHEHPVMDYLVKTRNLWEKAKKVKARVVVAQSDKKPAMDEVTSDSDDASEAPRLSKKGRKEKARLEAAEEAAARRARQIEDAEASFADLSGLVPKKKVSKKAKTVESLQEDDSDFGEEESMDAKSAADKAQKKKSLRFYTSQIAQKANKRAGAGRDAGGDEDLPHRERLRDRQARLNAEAEKRGKKLDEYGRGAAGAALGGDNDSGDDAVAAEVREDGDEYYDMVTKVSKQKKADKQDRLDAIKQAKAEGAMVRVVEGEVDEDGKRAIGYVIEKNKGLAPKRKKDVRNPRVKKRKKYEEKKKKLASTRAVYKGGEERGGYGGEKSGIKTGLVKSIKL